jgi:hypothetical protein
MSEDKIKLAKWKPKFKRGKPFAMLIFASRNSGKSYLMRHLIRTQLKLHYDIFVIISDSPDTKKDFEPCCPPNTIFMTDMNFSIINNLMKTNADREAKGKEPLQMLLLFDDKIGANVKNDDNLLQIFTRGRHINVSVIFSSQAKKMAETSWLNNADQTIILKQNSAQQRKTILENVLKGTVAIADNKRENAVLSTIMLNYCSNQGDALVIDNGQTSQNNLFWYRAP